MSNANHDFLGTGWSFPPTFANQGEQLEMVSGIEDIQQSLEIILSTQPRERLLHDDFGCELSNFLFEEIDQHLINRLRHIVEEAILYHEPRIEIQQVTIDESRYLEGLLLISITFFVRNTNSRYNMVYPFYLREAIGR
ncbi:MAG: GPW/gp25 family protein [Lewinellaceae bacterium]|nr:GPW/gp25 family protein [Lewinellaceae bacterium]